MQIFNSYLDYSGTRPAAVTMGMFDGVHLGHQRVIKDLTLVARKENLEIVLLTYWPHPRLYFNPDENLKLLSTKEEKIKYFEDLGVDTIVFQAFDDDFAKLTGRDFIEEVLAGKLNAKEILIGYDHIFGRQRSGDFNLLQSLSAKYGYNVAQAAAVEMDGRAVSSTIIRNLLQEGSVREAGNLLGRPYELSGEVVRGKQLGRTLGFPTANLEVSAEKLLPKEGAYIVEGWVNGKFHPAMASIGKNPTVNGEKVSVEVYLVNFSGDLYGQQVTVRFREWLHLQIKFETLEGLVEKLREDETRTIAFFDTNLPAKY